MRPLTVAMTPSFFYEGDNLLRAQLRCLSEQRAKDFSVLLVDSHYSKRKSYSNELAEHYGLDIIHVPYQPNLRIAKKLDCAVFNAAYCYSESPRIVRLSCWRFVRPDFTEVCLNSATNIDFRYHNCEAASPESAHAETDHNTLIWDTDSDEVRWGAVPSLSNSPGARWGPDSDTDEPAKLLPLNCYGNVMVFRDQWLSLNGCEETFTNTVHYEDIDFCIRARRAGLQGSRVAHKMYRLHHKYGAHSGRANIPPDHAFREPCGACAYALSVPAPIRFDLQARKDRGELDVREGDGVWVCRECLLCGPYYHSDPSEHLDSHSRIRSLVLPGYKIGRNLNVLVEDMDGKRIEEKVEIFTRSWEDPRYYVKDTKIETRRQRMDISDRISLLELAAKENPLGVVAEIGVAGAHFTKQILATWSTCSKLYAVDCWGSFKGNHITDNDQEQRFQQVVADLSHHNNVEIVRQYSHQAATSVPDKSIDFIYIDADHSYDAVLLDLRSWFPKLKRNGIMAGHDYYDGPGFGVKSAVIAFCIENKLDVNATTAVNSRTSAIYGPGWEGPSFWFRKP